MNSFNAAIIGAGPAGLMAAQMLAEQNVAVTVYERMPSVARKFLMAGRGGLNLSHSEPMAEFLTRYQHENQWLAPMIEAFTPDDLRQWAHDLGIETFIGSSRRIFPRQLKSSPLLRAWLARLNELGVQFALRHNFEGFAEPGILRFISPDGEVEHRAQVTILAQGGASWPRLGSNGKWQDILSQYNIVITPLQAANSGVNCPWSSHVLRFTGTALKNIAVSCDDVVKHGELVITKTGLEGGPVYALSPLIRAHSAGANLQLDLLPARTLDELTTRLGTIDRKQSLTNRLRKAARLKPPAIALWRDCAPNFDRSAPELLAASIKNLTIPITGQAGLARAISSAGGIKHSQLTADLSLKHMPGVFACGEMLDWDAPTGGYLLQACFATGRWAGKGAVDYVKSSRRV